MTLDPLTLNILSDVIANSVSAVFSYAYRRMTPKDEARLRQRLEFDKKLEELLQKPIASLAKSVRTNAIPIARLRTFLVSPEVEAIVRQLFSLRIIKQDGELDSARSELIAAMAFNLSVEQREVESIGAELFDLLMGGVEKALVFAAEHGSAIAHEALSSRRYKLLHDQIVAIRRNLEFLRNGAKASFAEIQVFEEQLRRQVLGRHASIIPPHFDSVRRIPLEELYVYPDLLLTKQEQQGQPLSLDTFLGTMHRAVLLGDPGAGKSTLAQKVCLDLSRHHSKRLLSNRLVTPAMVVLREYGAHKKEEKCSILEYIEVIAKSLYQLTPPLGAVEYLLLSGRMAVVFDGLDELLDTTYRQEVSLDIEMFCNLYTATAVLVTSRKVGYEQAPLDSSIFKPAYLAPFSQEKVEEYVSKWFSVQTDLPANQKLQKVDAFVKESRVVPDLRSNPLMLALMCNIYRGENYIPQNRPEVYEKCASMLFERWDKSRGIHVLLPFEAHIRPAMMSLAHWIYSHDELQGGVTEVALIAEAAEYLNQWRFDNIEEARRAAREFIEFCRGRAWIFTDVGTTKEGHRIYQFTHRTFLEYFAGAYLARVNETAEALAEHLLPRIILREWDVVAQLAFQIKAKASEGAADKILNALLDAYGREELLAGWNALSFSCRCLEFMVPNPASKRRIAEACVAACINWGLQPPKDADHGAKHRPFFLLGDILSCSVENRQIVSRSIEDHLLRRIDQGTEHEAYLCLELGLNFSIALGGLIRPRVASVDSVDYWNQVSQRIGAASKARIIEIHPRYPFLSNYLFHSKDIGLEKVLELHGLEALFRHQPYQLSPGTRKFPLAMSLADPYRIEHLGEHGLSALTSLGRFLEAYASPPPWFDRDSVEDSSRFLRLGRRADADREILLEVFPSYQADAWFGMFVLQASIAETGGEIAQVGEDMTQIIQARISATEQGPNFDLELRLSAAHLSPRQERTISLWVTGSLSFVKERTENSEVTLE